MNIKIGDLFYLDVAYENNPSIVKNRPVLLLDEYENNVLLLISTTTKGRRHPLKWYDDYKIPIQNWRKTGLREASWCMGKNLINISRVELESILENNDYIGRMHPEDFNFIVEELERIHHK